MNDFLDARRTGLSPATMRWYAGRLRPFAAQHSTVELDQLSVRDARNYIADLRSRTLRYENATQRRKVDGGLSDETIRGHIRALRKFFAWCIDEYSLMIPNVMKKVEGPRRGSPVPKANHTADLKKLLEACPESAIGRRDKSLLAFLADTGCRASGVLTLRMDDLNLDQGQAIVHEKARRDRVVPLSPYTVGLLRDWLAVRPPTSLTVFCALSTNRAGLPLTLSGLHSMLKRLKKAAGVTGRVSPHGWRHHLGWFWLDQGGDLATLSLIMGHSDPATTLRYYAGFMMGEAIKKHRQFSPMKGLE